MVTIINTSHLLSMPLSDFSICVIVTVGIDVTLVHWDLATESAALRVQPVKSDPMNDVSTFTTLLIGRQGYHFLFMKVSGPCWIDGCLPWFWAGQ